MKGYIRSLFFKKIRFFKRNRLSYKNSIWSWGTQGFWGGFVTFKAGIAFLFITSGLFISCQKHTSDKFNSAAIDETLVLKVTKENFINGKKFCQMYVNAQEEKSKEFGIWIKVPVDYQQKSKGTMEIYAYTRKPFNPQLPSVIFVDGGPGQNTHQIEDLLPNQEINQINFDQRGVGCSTPETWEQYADHTLYSSEKTVQDMEEIRKAYKISQWSVYGVSYGTIPSTIYAAKYKEAVQTVTLEGVVGSVENLGRFGFKAEKWNLVLKSLNSQQRASFDKIINSQDEQKIKIIFEYFAMSGYRDAGYKQLKDKILVKLLPEQGGFNEEFYQELKRNYYSRRNKYSTPQQPGAVDDNILTIFYCKELGAFEKDKYTLDYNLEDGFFERPTTSRTTWKDDCYKHNINESDQNLYNESDYQISDTIYYLQGSHDAATIAKGAWAHWRTVPKGRVYFLFSIKGGHNPGLSKLNSEDSKIKSAHQELYRRAIMGEDLNAEFVNTLNSVIYKNETNENLKIVNWQLYTKIPRDFSTLESQLDGFKKLSH